MKPKKDKKIHEHNGKHAEIKYQNKKNKSHWEESSEDRSLDSFNKKRKAKLRWEDNREDNLLDPLTKTLWEHDPRDE